VSPPSSDILIACTVLLIKLSSNDPVEAQCKPRHIIKLLPPVRTIVSAKLKTVPIFSVLAHIFGVFF